MKRILEKLIINDYVRRNLTVQEIAKFRRVQRMRVSNVLKDKGVLLTFSEKKKKRESFDLKTLPFELREHSFFYVYGLKDSLSNEIFYIGKGKAERYRDHFYETKNKRKKDRMSEIVSKGGEVIVEFYHKNLTEKQALEAEMALIQSTPNLMNILKK